MIIIGQIPSCKLGVVPGLGYSLFDISLLGEIHLVPSPVTCSSWAHNCPHSKHPYKMALSISFKDKRILITGATRGLGHDLVRTLYKHDAIIYALARNATNLANLKEEFPKIHIIQADLTDWDATRKQIEAFEPMDHLINNAGIVTLSPFLSLKPQDFDDVMNTNVKAAINVSQVVAKKMIENGMKGSIINVSSMGSKVYSKNLGNYCISKAALDMLTKSMAVELGPHGIRVNSVNPSIFPSDMSKAFLTMFPDGGPDYLNRIPLKQIATPDEIVNAILFLMSDAAPMVHGETLVIDGGFTLA